MYKALTMAHSTVAVAGALESPPEEGSQKLLEISTSKDETTQVAGWK